MTYGGPCTLAGPAMVPVARAGASSPLLSAEPCNALCFSTLLDSTPPC